MIKKVKNFITENKEELMSMLLVTLLVLIVVEFIVIFVFKVMIDDLVSKVRTQEYDIVDYQRDIANLDKTVEDLVEAEEWCITKYGEELNRR